MRVQYAISVLGLLMTPTLLGLALMITLASDILIMQEPPPIADIPSVKTSQSATRVAILTSNHGVQANELLMSYRFFASLPDHWVFTVAKKRQPSPLTGSAAFIPDFNFNDAPSSEILIIPSSATWDDPEQVAWLKQNESRWQWIICLSEGLRVLSPAGLLQGQRVTAQPRAAEDMRSLHPGLRWLNERATQDGKLITARSSSATLDALRIYAQNQNANHKKDLSSYEEFLKLHPSQNHQQLKPAFTMGIAEMFFLFLSGGYHWHRPGIGVQIYDGIDELALAAALDTINYSWSARIVSFAAEKRPHLTRHGLMIVPTLSKEELPMAEAWIIPAGKIIQDPKNQSAAAIRRSDLDLRPSPIEHPLDLSQLRTHLQKISPRARIVDQFSQSPTNNYLKPFEEMIALIELWTSRSHAEFAMNWTELQLPEYPPKSTWQVILGLPLMVWFRILGISLMGLTVLTAVHRHFGRRSL